MLAQVFVAERQQQANASGTCQTCQQTARCTQPPVAPAHVIESEQSEQQEDRFVVGCREEEGSRKYSKIERGAPGQVGIEVFLHQAVEYSEHQQACSI